MKVAPLPLVCILPKYNILQAKSITDVKVIQGALYLHRQVNISMRLIGKLELGVLTVVPM